MKYKQRPNQMGRKRRIFVIQCRNRETQFAFRHFDHHRLLFHLLIKPIFVVNVSTFRVFYCCYCCCLVKLFFFQYLCSEKLLSERVCHIILGKYNTIVLPVPYPYPCYCLVSFNFCAAVAHIHAHTYILF